MKSVVLARMGLALGLSVLMSAAVAQTDMPRLAKVISVNADAAGATRQFFGHVVAKETVDLAFQVGGQIVDLPVTEGARVESGSLIAALDVEPFELALDQAQVQYDQALRTFERLEQLQGGAVSQVSVDDAQTQVQIAQIALRDAERSLRNAQLTAPFVALVASRNVANFSTISAGTPVVRLHDMSDLRIEIDVPEILFQQAGQNPNITLTAKFPASDAFFPLAVREYNAETSDIGQTYTITLGMEPPENLVVLPGSSVTVFAQIMAQAEVIHVPNSAIINANDGSTQVMVFTPTSDDEGTVEIVPVTIEPDTSGRVTVVSGLGADQEIIASGANMLEDGETVRRFQGFAQ